MGVTNIELPGLYPKQRAVFFGPERISVCEATTKAGKSVGALVWQMSRRLEDTAGRSGVWVSPGYVQAEGMFNRVCRWLRRADPMGEVWESNSTKLCIKFTANGAMWYFKGSENYDGIYGPDYADAVVDEASRCREEAWHAVRSTLTATQGPIRIIGNVKGRKNWAYRMARKAEAGEPGYAYHKLTAADAVAAGIIKASEVEQARRDLPEAVFRELYMAEPSDDGGNPFGLQHIAACVGAEGEGPVVCWGVDLAKSQDWSVVIGLNQAGAVVYWDRWQGPWSQTVERLTAILKETPALVDSTGVGDPIVEELQRRLPMVEGYGFTSKSKQQLMEGLAVAIQQREVTYPDGPIRSELDSFEYEYQRLGVRYSAPPGSHDDCVCALALAKHKHSEVASGSGFYVGVARGW